MIPTFQVGGLGRMRKPSGAAPLSYNATVLADSPAGYWILDETSGTTAVDSSGNGRDGSYVASPTLASSGVTLNGTSQYVSISNAALNVIGAASQQYTLEIFVTEIAGAAQPSAIMDKTRISGPADWNLLQYTSPPNWQLYDGTNNPIATTATQLSNGTEYILHGVRDATTIKLYRDGSLVQSTAASSAIDCANTIALCLGARSNGTDRFNKCKLRRAAVYLTALNGTQIAARQEARNR